MLELSTEILEDVTEFKLWNTLYTKLLFFDEVPGRDEARKKP